jgi:hypothetical protein
VIAQPRAQCPQTLASNFMNQMRERKRKSRLVRAPTGQRSMMFIE